MTIQKQQNSWCRSSFGISWSSLESCSNFHWQSTKYPHLEFIAVLVTVVLPSYQFTHVPFSAFYVIDKQKESNYNHTMLSHVDNLPYSWYIYVVITSEWDAVTYVSTQMFILTRVTLLIIYGATYQIWKIQALSIL